ncbi:Heat shock protein [Thalictrum thalictroides]|uniref:Heat shock protein n=1 Tax=Thalictrum thalictroides TaxID=46969 RepID=A0A7J6X9L3_THATH|nr:Heat shock protein [Thalictrum thalictroides]
MMFLKFLIYIVVFIILTGLDVIRSTELGSNVDFAAVVLVFPLICFIFIGLFVSLLTDTDKDFIFNLLKTFFERRKLENPAKVTKTPLFKKWLREENDSLNFRVEMPGLSRKDVKLTVEKNVLLIEGDVGNDDNVDECATKYIIKFEIPTQLYDIYSINSQMENGVLKVMVPKVEEVKNDSF